MMATDGKLANHIRILLRSRTLTQAFIAGFMSGVLGGVLRFMDVNMGMHFLEDYNPDPVVFNVFVVFASLVAAFRTSHALVRYTDAASLMHQLCACWYDTTSTLVAFLRTSHATAEEITHFQETLIRLISLLNALCLDGLEQKESDFASGHSFEVIGWKDLTEEIQDGVMSSQCRVEFVFQEIQKLVVDGMKANVVTIAAPILTRSFQEMGAGMLIYHEAKKLSCVPLPFAYAFITRVILIAEAAFFPFMLAVHTKGILSTFCFTFGGTVMLWFLNGVAESLDNPFRKEASSLETSHVQEQLNVQLRELVRRSSTGTPTLRPEWKQATTTRRLSATPESMDVMKRSFSQTRLGSTSRLGRTSNLSEGVRGSTTRRGSSESQAGLPKEDTIDPHPGSWEPLPERTGTPPRSPREGLSPHLQDVSGEPKAEPLRDGGSSGGIGAGKRANHMDAIQRSAAGKQPGLDGPGAALAAAGGSGDGQLLHERTGESAGQDLASARAEQARRNVAMV